jgi:hypothetical protein
MQLNRARSTMFLYSRFRVATRAACIHLIASLIVGLLVSVLVFGLWYRYPYTELSGGRELFLLVMVVDVACGPLITAVLFDPSKRTCDLRRDLAVVLLLQLGALAFGLWSVWQARPLFLVLEIDRFKVVAAPDLQSGAVAGLPTKLQPRWWSGPLTVAIREPRNAEEHATVMFESVQGGRGYAERPEFFLAYEGAAALTSLRRAKSLAIFLQKQPDQQVAARLLAAEKGADIAQWLYLPVTGRQDWTAVLDKQGQIQGFLKGDGF